MNEQRERFINALTQAIRNAAWEGNVVRMSTEAARIIVGMLKGQDWISVKDRLPEEHESIFHKFLGTPRWSSAMWKQESDKVLVCVSFPDGTSVVTTGRLHDSDWVTTVGRTLPQTVTHWMPLPEPPEVEA